MTCEINKAEEFLTHAKSMGIGHSMASKDGLKTIMGSDLFDQYYEYSLLEEYDSRTSNATFGDLIEEEFGKNIDNGYNPSDAYLDHIESIVKDIDSFMKESGANINIKFFDKNNDNEQASGSASIDPTNKNNQVAITRSDITQVSSSGEILAHEATHIVARGGLNVNKKLRKRVRALKDIVKKIVKTDDGLKDIFLHGIAEPTDTEIAMAINKSKYILDKNANDEEFLAYALTNPNLFDFLTTISKDVINNAPKQEALQDFMDSFKALDKSNGIGDLMYSLAGIFSAMFKNILTSITNTAIEDNGSKEVASIFKELKDLQVSEYLSRGENFENFINKYVPFNVVASPLIWSSNTLDKTINKLEQAYGSQVSTKMKKELDKYYKKALDYTVKNTDLKNTANTVASILKIKDIWEGGLFQNLLTKTLRAESTNEFSEVLRAAKSMNAISTENMAMKNSFSKMVGETIRKFNDGDKYYEKKLYTHIIGSGLYMFAGDFVGNDLDRVNLSLDLKAAQNIFSEDEIDKMDSIASMIINNKASSNYRILDTLDSDSVRNKDKKDLFENAARYIVLKTLSMKSEDELSFIQKQLDKPEIVSLARQFNTIENKMSPEERMELPFSPIFRRATNERTKVIHIGTKQEATAIGSKLIGKEPFIEIDGHKYYKYSTFDNSPSNEIGVLSKTKIELDGYKMSNLFKKHLALTTEKGEQDGQDLEYFIRNLELKGNVDMSSFVPIYKNGSLVDYIMLYTDKDKVVTMNDSSTYTDKLVSQMYRTVEHNSLKIKLQKIMNSIISVGKIGGFDEDIDHTYISLGEISSEYGIPIDKEYKMMMVPKSMVNLLTGTTRSTLANIGLTIGGKRHEIKNQSYKNIVKNIETIVSDFITKNKGNIALFNSSVFMGNMTSNSIVVSGFTGKSPLYTMKRFINDLPLIEELQDLVQEIADIKSEIESGKDDKETMMNFSRKKQSLMIHPYYKLYKAGHLTLNTDGNEDVSNLKTEKTLLNKFYSSEHFDREVNIEIERLKANGTKLSDTALSLKAKRNVKNNKIVVNKYLSKTIKTIYSSPSTFLSKKAANFLIASDIVAKKIILEHEEKKPEFDEDKFMSEMSDIFVNYDEPVHGILQWLENIGGIIFQKYFLGSIKSYILMLKKRPASVALFLGGEALTGIDITDPTQAHSGSELDKIANRWAYNDVGSLLETVVAPPMSQIAAFNINAVVK